MIASYCRAARLPLSAADALGTLVGSPFGTTLITFRRPPFSSGRNTLGRLAPTAFESAMRAKRRCATATRNGAFAQSATRRGRPLMCHRQWSTPAYPRIVKPEASTMANDTFDALTRRASTSLTRRQTLFGLATAFGSALFALAGRGTAFAAPQTCVTCVCGVGNPCNPKSTTCTELRGFPADQSCETACQRNGQHLCSAGTAFHCPKGCP